MDNPTFLRVETSEGLTLLNLANVSAIVADNNGSFGVRRRVTVHLSGGATIDFDDEYADKFSDALSQSGLLGPVPR